MGQLNADTLELLEKNFQKFEQYFVYHKYPPINPNSSENLRVGQQFHLLMQQLMMGLPVEPLLLAYPEMAHWVKQLHPIVSIPAQKKQCNVYRTGKRSIDRSVVAKTVEPLAKTEATKR